ncbi:B3 domain-containing protein At2g36080-like [Alnus glutinosa]|uniref:B3 domain-containing protein At2g36080-like n=1 Tax=Alnus glutinosa TaxID=3517 RepID=UPI002D78E185|nr:B3 domain-containing protein At2g36080-like [Alnus glutinosa]
MAETTNDVSGDSKYCRQVFSKILSQNDIQEGRVYIAKSDATIFCPAAFGCPSNERKVIEDFIFYDIETKPWTIHFCSDGDEYYLTRGWSQFARVKKLSKGDSIMIYELKPRKGTKERAFMVGVTRKMDVSN